MYENKQMLIENCQKILINTTLKLQNVSEFGGNQTKFLFTKFRILLKHMLIPEEKFRLFLILFLYNFYSLLNLPLAHISGFDSFMLKRGFQIIKNLD